MDLERDLKKIAEQEQALRFTQFGPEAAWSLGASFKTAAEQRGVALAIDVTLGQQTVFFYSMPGTTPDHANWIRRKRNTVLHFHRSSYAMGLQLARDKTDLVAKYALPHADYAVHGGGFPLRLVGGEMLGAVVISGLPQRQDHALLVEVLATVLGKPAGPLALE